MGDFSVFDYTERVSTLTLIPPPTVVRIQQTLRYWNRTVLSWKGYIYSTVHGYLAYLIERRQALTRSFMVVRYCLLTLK